MFLSMSIEDDKLSYVQPKPSLAFDLLHPTPTQLKSLKPVSVPDIMTSSTNTPHPAGLYSIEIFGIPGSEERKSTYSYIDLRSRVIHPMFYINMVKAKKVYEEIMMGKTYATFSKENGFEVTDPLNGETGYSFFIKHLDDLTFESTDSLSRSTLIQFKRKQKEKLYIENLMVMPAGMRDLQVDADGKPEKEDEISVLYANLIKLTQYLPVTRSGDPVGYDQIIFRIQKTVNEIYLYLFDVTFNGKKKFALGKWGSRNVAYGSRGILGTLVNKTNVLGSDEMIKPNQTVLGLYQYIASTQPTVIYGLRTKLFERIFDLDMLGASVPRVKDQKFEDISLSQAEIQYFTSKKGIEKLISKFLMDDLRHEPVMVTPKHYLALVHRHEDRVTPVLSNEHAKSFTEGVFTPITYAEMFYISVYKFSEEQATQVTRYPAGALGGTYLSNIALTTTVKNERVIEMDDWGNVVGVMLRYPRKDSGFFNSFSPHTSHLGRLGADQQRSPFIVI